MYPAVVFDILHSNLEEKSMYDDRCMHARFLAAFSVAVMLLHLQQWKLGMGGSHVQEQLQATEAAKPRHATVVASLGGELMEVNLHTYMTASPNNLEQQGTKSLCSDCVILGSLEVLAFKA